jgi:hypothetical protein
MMACGNGIVGQKQKSRITSQAVKKVMWRMILHITQAMLSNLINRKLNFGCQISPFWCAIEQLPWWANYSKTIILYPLADCVIRRCQSIHFL